MMEQILSIVWYKVLPARFGGQKGTALFNQYLSHYHPLVCLCSANNEPPAGLSYKVSPKLPDTKTQFFLPSCHRMIIDTARREKISHIIVEHPFHGYAAVKARKATGAKLIVHSHNIESERFRQLGKWWWRLLRYYERWVHRRADLNLFKTEADQAFAISAFGIAPAKCMIIPYGIERTVFPGKNDATIRQRHHIDVNAKILLFAGTLDYAPNADAVKNIFSELASRLEKTLPGFRIIICGRNKFPAFHYLNELSHPAVIMAGEVTDIEHYFSAADVFINPVTYGGGMQTKNMDALAAHCNLVCFEQMMTADVRDRTPNKIFLAPTGNWETFVNQIAAASERKEETPPSFFEEYSWETITARVARQISSL